MQISQLWQQSTRCSPEPFRSGVGFFLGISSSLCLFYPGKILLLSSILPSGKFQIHPGSGTKLPGRFFRENSPCRGCGRNGMVTFPRNVWTTLPGWHLELPLCKDWILVGPSQLRTFHISGIQLFLRSDSIKPQLGVTWGTNVPFIGEVKPQIPAEGWLLG